jgi:hypothetical protein
MVIDLSAGADAGRANRPAAYAGTGPWISGLAPVCSHDTLWWRGRAMVGSKLNQSQKKCRTETEEEKECGWGSRRGRGEQQAEGGFRLWLLEAL